MSKTSESKCVTLHRLLALDPCGEKREEALELAKKHKIKRGQQVNLVRAMSIACGGMENLHIFYGNLEWLICSLNKDGWNRFFDAVASFLTDEIEKTEGTDDFWIHSLTTSDPSAIMSGDIARVLKKIDEIVNRDGPHQLDAIAWRFIAAFRLAPNRKSALTHVEGLLDCVRRAGLSEEFFGYIIKAFK